MEKSTPGKTKRIMQPLFELAIVMVIIFHTNPLFAQQTNGTEPYSTGNPIGMTVDGNFEPISPNVTVYEGTYRAESCIYAPKRGVIVVPSRGLPQNVQTNDAWISLIHHDGSVHTVRWIGDQQADKRENLSPPLVLNEPMGTDIINDILYVADRDGGTGSTDPSVAVIRLFDMNTGAPLKEIRIEECPWINDVEVKEDGTIYATQTGDFFGENQNPDTWKVWKVAPDGESTVFVQGSPLNPPNGIAFDQDGNIVVANFGDTKVVTFSPDGELLKTEHAVQAGSDGLVIMPDGTKYIGSVRQGGVSRIRPGESAELIANHIPGAASMCYDAEANQLVIPMSSPNTLAFIPLD